MTEYSIKVTLSEATQKSLVDQSKSLLVFKGIHGPPDMVSTVWYSTSSLASIEIHWRDNYGAYVSESDCRTGSNFHSDIESEKALKPGQLATVTEYNGLSIGVGTKDHYQISNNFGKQFRCGLTCKVERERVSAPICATILYGNFTMSMKPVEKVFLCFDNDNTTVGTHWTMATGNGYVIDLTKDVHDVTVTFDINLGWSCSADLATFCTPVKSNNKFANFLNSVTENI